MAEETREPAVKLFGYCSICDDWHHVRCQMFDELVQALHLFLATWAARYNNASASLSDGRRIVHKRIERVLLQFLSRYPNESVSVDHFPPHNFRKSATVFGAWPL